MPEEPEKSGQEPNLELPSLLGFGRRKKKNRKTDSAADKPAPDEAVAEEPAATEPADESDDPLSADPVPQARTGLAPATHRPKRPPPVPPPPATRPPFEVQPEATEPEVREPEVAPEPEVQPEQVATQAPETEPDVSREPEGRVAGDAEDTEVIENVSPPAPKHPATEPTYEQRPAAVSEPPGSPRSGAPADEEPVGWGDEEPVQEPIGEPVEAGSTRRERPPRRSLPVIAPLLAAGISGGVVGLVGVVLTSVAGRGCEVIRGVGSCGGIGLLALLVIVILEVLLGAVLLKAWRLSDPLSTSFLGVGLAAVFVLLFLLSSLESVWMVLVIPLLSVLTFVASWLVTETLGESSIDDLHR